MSRQGGEASGGKWHEMGGRGGVGPLLFRAHRVFAFFSRFHGPRERDLGKISRKACDLGLEVERFGKDLGEIGKNKR